MFDAVKAKQSRRRDQCKPCVSLSNRRRCEKNAVERGSQPPPSVKCCRKCRQTYPPSEFNFGKGTRDGLQSMCRACDSQSRSEMRLRLKTHNGASPPLATAGTERFCRHCNKTKPWAEFKKDTWTVYGIVGTLCKECHNVERARERMLRRLRKAGE